jgi:hypothetical protein
MADIATLFAIQSFYDPLRAAESAQASIPVTTINVVPVTPGNQLSQHFARH